MPGVDCTVVENGFPEDASVFDGADSIVVFADGGDSSPLLNGFEAIEKQAQRGAGLVVMHYVLDVPKGDLGERANRMLGGHYEQHWSVNPIYTGEFANLPEHPITRGVHPFAIGDEWYYHMRFVEDMVGVTPILTCTPPDSTRQRPDGPHSNNPTVRSRKGMPEHVAWTYERPRDAGRGFGFTGGHWHWNWAHDDYRKTVLNAIAWTAGIDVPETGIDTPTPTLSDLLENQDFEPWPEERMQAIRDRLRRFQQD